MVSGRAGYPAPGRAGPIGRRLGSPRRSSTCPKPAPSPAAAPPPPPAPPVPCQTQITLLPPSLQRALPCRASRRRGAAALEARNRRLCRFAAEAGGDFLTAARRVARMVSSAERGWAGGAGGAGRGYRAGDVRVGEAVPRLSVIFALRLRLQDTGQRSPPPGAKGFVKKQTMSWRSLTSRTQSSIESFLPRASCRGSIILGNCWLELRLSPFCL